MRDSVIVTDQEHCMICGRDPVQRHHIYHGTSGRRLADEDGYWVPLCVEHHLTGKAAVHSNRFFDQTLQGMAQRHYEKTHTREEFIARYGKSYI